VGRLTSSKLRAAVLGSRKGNVMLKKIAVVMVLVLLAVAVRAVEPVKLAEGTVINLKLLEEMRSGKTPKGSSVKMEVAKDITGPGGVVLISKGSKATGTVTYSKKRGMLGKNGKLEFTVDATTSVDGKQIPLRATLENSGKSNKGAVIASALLLSLAAVFVHGRDVTLKAGTEITAYVDKETLVSISKDAESANLVKSPNFSVTPTDIDKLVEALHERIGASEQKDTVLKSQIAILPFERSEEIPASLCSNIPSDCSMSMINLGYKVGSDTNAPYVISGNVTDRNGVLVISAKLVESASGQTILGDHIEILPLKEQ
jgi:hypothetical protein